MSKDIRLSIDFLTHRKRKKLQRLLGSDGVLCLIDLWLSTARQRPSGTLTGYDEIDIELDANWDGEEGLFVKTLLSIGLLDDKDGVYHLHNWSDRQGWVVESEDRGDKARFSRLAKVNPKVFKELKAKCVYKISKDDYNKIKEASTTVNESSNETSTNVEETTTPAPAPAPSPAPSPSPNDIKESKDSCSEPKQPGTEQESILEIPLIKKDGFFSVTKQDLDQWQETFPGIDIRYFLGIIRQWNIDNPNRRKTKSGIRRHISSWLSKEQNRAPKNTQDNPKTQLYRYRQQTDEEISAELSRKLI